MSVASDDYVGVVEDEYNPHLPNDYDAALHELSSHHSAPPTAEPVLMKDISAEEMLRRRRRLAGLPEPDSPKKPKIQEDHDQ